MLKVSGRNIVDEKGQKVILKGYNIGSWMMMENFMVGYPGTEEEFRYAVKKYAGEENYEYFFDRFLTYFFNEKDAAFLKEIGVNCIRIPFNYRHFESDNAPYQYKESGFKHMDRAIEICKKYGIYIILDLHAAQGHQSTHWHCDNNNLMPAEFFTNEDNRNRFIKLWVHIANRYKNEDIIAGYDLINEPVADNSVTGGTAVMYLNKVYRDATAAIREVDPDHIIFIAGNNYDNDFDVIDPPFTDNLAYTCHYYLDVCTSAPVTYPGKIGGLFYDRRQVELQMDARDEYMRKYNVPCWVGEFGVRLSYPGLTEVRLQAFGDQLDCIASREHHYSIWSYKDINFLGTVFVSHDSPWMKFTKDIRDLKKKYFVDLNFRVSEDWGISQMLQLKDPNGMNDMYGELKEEIAVAMKSKIASALADKLGQKFANLSKKELDELAASFDFDNCLIDEKRLEVIKRYGRLNGE